MVLFIFYFLSNLHLIRQKDGSQIRISNLQLSDVKANLSGETYFSHQQIQSYLQEGRVEVQIHQTH